MFAAKRALTVVLATVAVAAPFTAQTVATAADGPQHPGYTARDVARAAGLEETNKSWSAAPVDYDRDGDQDLWIGYHARPAKLWKNGGNGRFRRVALGAWPGRNRQGKSIDRHDCTWADVDRNGRPDAYCSTGRFTANVVKYNRDNELWLQNRRGGFHEVGTRWRVGDLCGRGRHVAFLDANGDRWPDLFLGNGGPRDVPDPCDKPRNRLPNEQSKIFINMRGERFRYAPDFGRFGAGPGTECVQVLDFNGDGWDDLLTCQEKNKVPRLYRNKAGRGFTAVTRQHRLGFRVNDAVAADLDHDRDPDLVTAANGGFAYHVNDNGTFGPRIWIDRLQGTRGKSVAVAEVNGDREPDVYGVVSSGQASNADDVVWINTKSVSEIDFQYVPVPPAGGSADQVVAVRPWRDRPSGFLVLNGFGRQLTGPVQLIRVLPVPPQ